MHDINAIVQKVRGYLESVGVDSVLLDNELNDVKAVLVLNLPEVCILKKNRMTTGGNQTHIHVTGEGMGFFFDKEVLEKNPTMYAKDVKENIILFKKNLIDLEDIAASRKNVTREGTLRSKDDIIDSYTLKKVGRIGSPSIQVQISKLRQDDKWFIHLRECLFTNDVLIFIKTARRESDIVVAIPYSYIKNGTINNTVIFSKSQPKEEKGDLEPDNVTKERNPNLRSVDFGSIAKFAPTDEEDEKTNSVADLTESIQTRKKRTERHHDIVKLIALDLEREGYSLYENPIDCLAALGGRPALLFEVKTLDGSESDEKKQVQKAFSQLFYYEMFNAKQFSDNGIEKIAVFESKIKDEHITFLEKNNIKVTWLNESKYLVDVRGTVKF